MDSNEIRIMNRIAINKRIESLNNTHNNLVDDSIDYILCFKYTRFYYLKLILYNILTFGIISLVCLIKKNSFINIYCVPCSVTNADIFLIIDYDNHMHMAKAKKENFYFKYKFINEEHFFQTNFKDSNDKRDFVQYRKKFKETNSSLVKKNLENSIYIGEDYFNRSEEVIVLYYKNNKYIYLDSENQFSLIQFELNKYTNEEIYQLFSNGISNVNEYNYLLNKFGENEIKLKDKSLPHTIFRRLLKPLSIYLILVVAFWIYNTYYFYFPIISVFLILLFITSYQKYLNHKKVFNDNYLKDKIIVQSNIEIKYMLDIWKINPKCERELEIIGLKKENNPYKVENKVSLPKESENFKVKKEIKKYFWSIKNIDDKPESITNLFIVPGDIIHLEQGMIVPCDCIILDGYCSVVESYLTGESNNILKEALPKNSSKFTFESTKSILYQGTEINRCESDNLESEGNYVKCLVINTGFNTFWGSFLQNLLFPNKMNFNFYRELQIFIYIMIIMYIITGSILIYFQFHNILKKGTETPDEKFKRLFNFGKDFIDMITVVIPPTLYLCMNVTSFYFNEILKRKDITCISEKRLNASGKVNTIVLDKTGTLTSDGLDISGFQTTKLVFNRNEFIRYDFDEIVMSLNIFNKMHREFWMRFSLEKEYSFYDDYQTNPRHNPIYFMECLATCLSIDKLRDNNILGNNMDRELYKIGEWEYKKIDEIWNNIKINYEVEPKHSYRITEQCVFDRRNGELKGNRYKIKIIKRFDFSSSHQSNSVIIKNELDESYRYYIKGAPEKIRDFCIKESLPDNFNEILKKHTQSGYRILACATKPLKERLILSYFKQYRNQNIKDQKTLRTAFEKDLLFLGFIIVSNKLKSDTAAVISNLKKSNAKIVIATGDNPFTSISVAEQCSLIEKNDIVFFDIQDNNLTYNWINKESDEENAAANSRSFSDNIIYSEANNPNNNITDENNWNKQNPTIRNNQIFHFDQTNFSGKRFLQEKSRGINQQTNLYVSNFNKILTNKKNLKLRKFCEQYIYEDIVLCVSGKALKYILEKLTEHEKLDKSIPLNVPDIEFYCKIIPKIISEKAKIFYRMTPDDKVKLIRFFKKDKNNVVAMCGDGANDCGALLSADIGIALNDNDSAKKLTSHFSYKYDSISCIDIILRNGRACFENNIMVLKYIICYAAIQTTTALCLSGYNEDMTDNQYLYQDFLIVLFLCFFAAKTGAAYQLSPQNSRLGILDSKFIYTMLTQIILQSSSTVGFFYFVIKKFDVYENYDKLFFDNLIKENDLYDIKTEYPFIISSFMFLYGSFQYINLIFAFNLNSKHRKYFYSNKTYLLYLSFIIFFTANQITSFFPNGVFSSKPMILLNFYNKYEHVFNELNKIYLLLFIFANLMLTLGIELISNLIFPDEIHDDRFKIEKNLDESDDDNE